MAVLRTRVTGPVMLPDGSPAPNGGKVIFRLRSWDRQGGALIMKGPEEAVVVGGVIDKTLNRTSASERGTLYDVIYTYPNAAARGQWLEEPLGSISLTGAGPVALADLLAIPAPVPNVPDVLAQALGAAASSGVDAGRAEEARGGAETAAGAAAGSAGAAAQALADAEVVLTGAGLPLIAGPDARKTLRVKPDGSGYYLASRPMVAILAYSQSNFARTQPLTSWDGPIPDNLFVWNGGVGGTVGTQFNPVAAAFTNQMRVPVAYAARLAAESPDTDFYLVICASGGVGVRSVVGMRYNWATSLAGDPGTGKIGLNHASPGSATQVRYSETDAEGWVRFVGGSSLGVSAVTPCRIEVAGNPAAYVEIRPGAVTDQGAYRTQPVTVSGSASWPPADGTPVNVYQATDWLREIIRANSEAALTWLGLTGVARKFDRMILWPTESDVAYADSYVQRDFPALLDYLGAWADAGTQYLHTLPWPHTTISAAGVRRWWSLLKAALAQRSGQSTLIDLRPSPISAWEPGVNDYVHVNTGVDMQMIGRMIRDSERIGGITLAPGLDGYWTPTVTLVSNLDAASVTGRGMISMPGLVGSGAVRLNVDPIANAAQTTLKLSAPPGVVFRNATDVIGQCASSVRAFIGNVSADPVDNTVVVTFTAESTVSHQLWVSFNVILP